MTKKYAKMMFEVDEMPGCCGIGIAYHFNARENGYYDWYSRSTKKPDLLFTTKKQQAEDCYKDILNKTDDYTQVLVSLVSSYHKGNGKPEGSHQWPELEEVLLREGWTIFSVFINPNHGNEVTLYGKYFPERDRETDEDDLLEPEDETEVF